MKKLILFVFIVLGSIGSLFANSTSAQENLLEDIDITVIDRTNLDDENIADNNDVGHTESVID